MYEAFYNLSARPFQLIPDPRLLFSSRDHARALSYLIYGLDRQEGFVVISGDVGTGKTLLVQTLLQEIKHRDIQVARLALANLDAESVVPAVASALGVAIRGRSRLELLEALGASLRKQARKGALVIIDEAQSATVSALEELRMIANLEDRGRALVQIFLVGQTELRSRLRDPAMAHLRQRIVAAHHLEPLARDEVRDYVEHRLRRVGWRDDPDIDIGVYDRVYEHSGGVPRRINRLMDRLLLFGYLESEHALDGDDLDQVVAEAAPELDDMLSSEQDGAADSAGSPDRHAELDELGLRLQRLEQTLCRAFGVSRVERLLASHQSDAGDRAMISMQLRLSRIERACRELLRQDGLEADPADDDFPNAGDRG